jgi:phosphoglycolate phosphatase-like HAD superfamily hydrolase
MIKGILFDLDGTLVRLPIRYNIIFEKLRILFDTKDEFKPLIPTILTKANNDVNLIQRAFDLICDEETTAAKNFEVIENAIEILDHFKNENFSLGLVTMQCKKAAKLVLDSMNISNHLIGDRIHDVDSAKQVGCSAILSNKNKLDSFKDSPVISELLELKKINFS